MRQISGFQVTYRYLYDIYDILKRLKALYAYYIYYNQETADIVCILQHTRLPPQLLPKQKNSEM